MKSNGCKSLLNILMTIYDKATIYVNELVLTPVTLTTFAPLGNKYKKLNLMW